MEQKQHHDSKFLVIGAGVAAVFLLLLFSWLGRGTSETKLASSGGEVAEAEAVKAGVPDGFVRRYSDGVPVLPEDQVENLYAVMVENSAEAWPLSGLDEARLVFEAQVEGAIPRFMVIFDDKQDVKEIGPVRSARPYYVEWADGLQALYAHVGGSPDGLARVQTLGVPSLNQFYFSEFFWRSDDRYAPHNVYTTTQQLEDGFFSKEYKLPELRQLFAYHDAPVSLAEAAEVFSVTVPFSSVGSQYDARWMYEPELNGYRRSQGGEVQVLRDESEVLAANVAVLFTDIRVVDEVGRREVRTIGEGEGRLYQGGLEKKIVWKKNSPDDPLEFEDEDGHVARLNPGPTWIEVVPTTTQITVDNVQ